MIEERKKKLLEYIAEHPFQSSKEIFEGLGTEIGYSTVKRMISQLMEESLIISEGKGKASKYRVSSKYELFYPVDIEQYFEKEIDDRKIRANYNFTLIKETLPSVSIFNTEELEFLNKLQNQYLENIKDLSEQEYNRELERLAIDLSWKSSQIEGNTYSLLETERLLKEKETAKGKPKDDAIMLLNHKEAIDFILENKDYLSPLSLSRIEDIHSLLIKDLGVERNIRIRRVGILGTNYVPLDNEHQIREALREMCTLINERENIFEKALLALALFSYLQAFSDGNKRTARILSNAQLLSAGYCPLSFRTVDSVDYKKAMLVFYEQNNLHALKQLFIQQFEFAVKTYF